MHRLLNLQEKSEKMAIGLMSGTSVDGIDAALVRIRGRGVNTGVELLNFTEVSYPAELREQILTISQPGGGNVETICRMNVLLGEIFASAAIRVLEKTRHNPTDIDFIGSHGQTIHHLPEAKPMFGYGTRGTLQIGEPAVIAARTGILTVADFRPADMAIGGQGAPLVPYFDFVLFRSEKLNRALVNIGGICNITILQKQSTIEDVLAYDTGPGNMMVDFLMRELFQVSFDRNGETAMKGHFSAELVALGMQHPYLALPTPKSTGREAFGAEFSHLFLEKGQVLGLPPEDIITSAAELTIRALVESCQRAIAPDIVVDEYIVSGGGVHNQYFMSMLRQRLAPARVCTVDELGVPPDAKEAICFAVLANETVHGNPSNVPAATGASGPAILGKICF